MTAQAPPFRDASSEVANHAKRLLAGRRETDLGTLGLIYRHRMARIAFGWVGTFAALVALLGIAVDEEAQLWHLGSAWLAAIAGGVAGYLVAASKFNRWREREERISQEPHAVVLRLTRATNEEEQEDNGRYSLNRIDSLALNSHRLPLLVGAMLLPLTGILTFMLLCGAHESELSLIAHYGLLYTIHVHIYAAIAAWRFPEKRGSAAMIGIAAALGVLPFVLSALVVGAVAAISVALYYLPITWWVDRESQWIANERQERIAAKAVAAKAVATKGVAAKGVAA